MRIAIPDDLKGKDLFKFLVDNKSALINEKKSMLKYADVVSCVPDLVKQSASKMDASGDDPDMCKVKIVGNTANYCDSQMDVLLPDCWNKSLKERKGMIPHLHDHIHQIGAEVGEPTAIYGQTMLLSELGIAKAGSTQCLIMESNVLRSYNAQVFEKYKAKKIKQHSIGLQYVKLGLAINDEESVAEYELWQKYAPNVINQDLINEKGFFWVVPEIKLLEISAVLFGSNPITPTLESKHDTAEEPSEDTHTQPSEKFDIGQAIKTIKLFN